jgi:inosine-uridine nucleoside N-ribohydrolase
MDTDNQMGKRAVILDVDAGVDDAFAILLALASPELEVLAITTVSGNVHVDSTTRNVLRILSLLSRGELPLVAKGEAAPLKKELFTASKIHGEDGLGDLGDDYYPPLDWGLVSAKPAADLLPELVAGRPGQVIIVSTGPVTNVAKAIMKAPDLMCQAREIVVMGGAIDRAGNIPPLYASEFNTYVDPDALDTVLKSGIPVTLVPTDVTHGVCLTRDKARNVLTGPGSVVSRFAFDCAQKYMDFNLATEGIDGAYMHDPLTVATVVDPSLVTTVPRRIYVDTREGMTRGMTVPFRYPDNVEGTPNCLTAVTVDSRRFIRMLLGRIGSSR